MDDQEHPQEVEAAPGGQFRNLAPFLWAGLVLVVVVIALFVWESQGGRKVEASAVSVFLGVSMIDARVDEEKYELTVRWLLETKYEGAVCSLSWAWTLEDGQNQVSETVTILNPLVGPNEWSGRVENPTALEFVSVFCD